MPWVKTDDALPDDPRVEAAGPAATGVLWLSLCYTNRNGTFGWVPKIIVTRYCRGDASIITTMMTVGMLRPEDRDAVPGFRIHRDYMQHQFTEQQVEERRAKKAAAGRKGGSTPRRKRGVTEAEHTHSLHLREAEREITEAERERPEAERRQSVFPQQVEADAKQLEANTEQAEAEPKPEPGTRYPVPNPDLPSL